MVTLDAARYRRWFLPLAFLFAALSWWGSLGHHFGHSRLADLVWRLFDLDQELAYPNWFSSLDMALSAVLLALLALAPSEKVNARAYGWLAVIFAFLSSDEVVGTHEIVGEHLHALAHTSGALRFAWVIPVGALVAAVGACYVPFLLRLPRRRAAQYVVAGLIYVGGAIGMELVGGKVYAAAGEVVTKRYVVCYHIEEILEMTGIILFNGALIEQLAESLSAGAVLKFLKG